MTKRGEIVLREALQVPSLRLRPSSSPSRHLNQAHTYLTLAPPPGTHLSRHTPQPTLPTVTPNSRHIKPSTCRPPSPLGRADSTFHDVHTHTGSQGRRHVGFELRPSAGLARLTLYTFQFSPVADVYNLRRTALWN
ncbi:hypothetical protein E2C01_020865 [Portunus trituberculatus]|uniref:Uncharacterized protein n=1 Tax=Portunus trituberculatus TaxID=210409 RepID=A0A5B7E2Y1_PORTR|nr:hypothetical protein [Portunus trituberculatus]